MSEVHGGTERLAPAGHVLQDELAEVGDELQIQMIDGLTGPAGTRGVAAHGLAKVAERRIRGIYQIEDELPARDSLLEAVHEDRVTFHLGKLKSRCQLTDDRAHDVLEDPLSMIQFGALEKRRRCPRGADIPSGSMTPVGSGARWTGRAT